MIIIRTEYIDCLWHRLVKSGQDRQGSLDRHLVTASLNQVDLNGRGTSRTLKQTACGAATLVNDWLELLKWR